MRESARRKDEFLAMLGHELRNPLAPIRNAAAVLMRIAGEDKQLLWVHDVLVRQVGYITRLVDDLLEISLVTQGALKLDREVVDLVKVIAEALAATEPLIVHKRHRRVARLGEQPVWIEGDAIRLGRIFRDLLGHAALYTEAEGELSVSLEVSGREAVVRVRDNGAGIAPGMASRVFELFVQDPRAVNRSEGSMGVGLALAHHLVGLHGGSIEACSDGLDCGTDLVVRLPLLAADRVPRPGVPTGSTGSGRLLIVDDDPDVGETLGLVLEMFGYEVARAFDGNSAVQTACQFRPDAVLMDIGLPGADGYEVVALLRALPEMSERVAYIAISGYPKPAPTLRTEAAAFAAYMVKPVDPDALGAVIEQTLLLSRQ